MTAAKTFLPRLSGFPVFLVVLFLVVGNLHAADDDEFLRALEAEVDKIEPTQQQEVAPNNAGSATNNSESRAQFEELLRERYHGSYVFYQKLPNRMQQEIYDDYANGESFAQLRKTIINRYLQQ